MSNSQIIQKRQNLIYEQLLTLSPFLSIRERCVQLNISQTTYYRILKKFESLNSTPKKKIKKIIEDRVQAGTNKHQSNITTDVTQEEIISNSVNNMCEYNFINCPSETNEAINANHPSFMHMIRCHPNSLIIK